jgi:hypothetical protein
MFLLAYGRSTCPELASRVDTKVSLDDTVSWQEGRWAVWPEPAVTAVVLFVHSGSLSVFFAAALTHTDDRDWRDGRALDDGDDPTAGAALLRRLDPTNLRNGERLRCPPSRRVPDKWSGRRPNKYMSRGSGLPVRNAKGCLSSEGGHRRLCAATSRHRRLCAVTSGPDAA